MDLGQECSVTKLWGCKRVRGTGTLNQFTHSKWLKLTLLLRVKVALCHAHLFTIDNVLFWYSDSENMWVLIFFGIKALFATLELGTEMQNYVYKVYNYMTFKCDVHPLVLLQ